MSRIALRLTLLASCWTGAERRPPEPGPQRVCLVPVLYVRYEAAPRAHAFDVAARAFDQATADYQAKRYLDAARGFMRGAASFFEADDVKDRGWSYENAATAWSMAERLDEAREQLSAAADHDPDLAYDLRRWIAELREPCHDR